MTVETVGSFLPDERLLAGREEFKHGHIGKDRLTEIEDEAVRDIVERQLASGLKYITSGELRRKHWAKDFWFGLAGISCERVETGSVYQPVEAATDLMRISGRIAFNPEHPFFDDFKFLHEAVAGRAACRQTLPSPANLLLEVYALSDGHPERLYPAPGSLISDIAEAYRATAMRLYEMGCVSIQYDDTALGLMCDDIYTKRLLQGGVDLINLHAEIIEVINSSLSGLPSDMEKSIYISGGDKIVPEWEYISYPDNIMPKALSTLGVDKFFMPFENGEEYPFEVLRHIPKGKKVVLGLIDAHSPFDDSHVAQEASLAKAEGFIAAEDLAVSPRTGFKLTSYSTRGLTYEDQWRKIAELQSIG